MSRRLTYPVSQPNMSPGRADKACHRRNKGENFTLFMHPTVEPNPAPNLPPITLRPEQPEDEEFLYDVYASTRLDELALTNWDEPMRRAFLNQQFRAMRDGYRSMFPTGKFLIIEAAGTRVGRMVINRSEAEIRVVDLALLPARRNRGIGTYLMRRVCTGADKPVRLSVLINNRAGRWYERLGFNKIGEMGIYDEMEWRPPVTPASPAD